MTNNAEELVERVKDIPTLPSVVMQINRVLQDDGASLESVVSIIEKDPSLTTKLLRLANSSYYGMSRDVRTVKEAVLILGLNTIRSIAMAVSVGKLFRGDSNGVLDAKELWFHSLYCAVASKGMMRHMGTVLAEEGFICGLVHDIGKIVIALNLPEETKRVSRELLTEEGRSWWEAEEVVLGFNHADVGGLIARRWNFPEVYCRAIECHHSPGRNKADGDEPEIRLAYSLFEGDAVAKSPPTNGTEQEHEPDPTALQALGIEPGDYPGLLEKIREDFENVMSTWDLE